MPEIISYAKNPRMFVLTQIGLQVLSMLIAIDIIGAGFYALITLKADRALSGCHRQYGSGSALYVLYYCRLGRCAALFLDLYPAALCGNA